MTRFDRTHGMPPGYDAWKTRSPDDEYPDPEPDELEEPEELEELDPDELEPDKADLFTEEGNWIDDFLGFERKVRRDE